MWLPPQALYRNLAELPQPLRVEFELRVAEGPFCRSFHLSDAEFARVLRLPGKVTTTLDTLRQCTVAVPCATMQRMCR